MLDGDAAGAGHVLRQVSGAAAVGHRGTEAVRRRQECYEAGTQVKLLCLRLFLLTLLPPGWVGRGWVKFSEPKHLLYNINHFGLLGS